MKSTRRMFLSGLSTVLVGLSGCSASIRGENSVENPSFSIGNIEIQNKHNASHSFHVLIQEDGEPVFWKSYRADGAKYKDGRLEKPTGTIWEAPSGTAKYTIYARVDNRESWEKADYTEIGRECVTFEIELETDNYLQIETRGCDN